MVAGSETVVFGKGISVKRSLAEPCPVVAPLKSRPCFPLNILSVYAIVKPVYGYGGSYCRNDYRAEIGNSPPCLSILWERLKPSGMRKAVG